MKKLRTLVNIFLISALMGFFSICSAEKGNFHALVIGVDKYKDSQIKGPGTAEKDAISIGDALKNKFGFKVKVLVGKDALKSNIVSCVDNYIKKLRTEDLLFIYFSGSSEGEPLYGYGWWLPYDAFYGDTMSYIDSVKVGETLEKLKSRVIVATNTSVPPDFTSKIVARSKNPMDSVGIKFGLVSRKGSPVKSSKDSSLSVLGYSIVKSVKLAKSNSISGYELISDIKKTSASQGVVLDYKSLGISKVKKGDFIISTVSKKVEKKEEPKKKKERPAVIEEAKLLIQSSPHGAEFLVDDKLKGETPSKKLSLKPGKYTIKVYKKGYKSKTIKLLLKNNDDRKIEIDLEKLPPKKGRLVVKINPLGAKIEFKNSSIKFTNNMEIMPGSYSLLINSPFYKKKIVDFKIEEGKEKFISEKLTPLKYYKNSIGSELVRVSKGDFDMGSPGDEFRRGGDEVLHKVLISKDFFIMKKEVSIGEWRKFIKETGYKSTSSATGGAEIWIGYKWEKDNDYSWSSPGFDQSIDHPVTCVSFADAVEFSKWLSKKENLNYSLPTEAEWEYSCRTGGKTAFGYGDCLLDSQANFAANSKRGNCPEGQSRNKTIATGSLSPNNWEIFDMHGNVMEWCVDWYGPYSGGNPSDPKGPLKGEYKVLRGGSWETDINNCRSANRFRLKPMVSRNNIGFRLVLRP